jgi:hypothetical protein
LPWNIMSFLFKWLIKILKFIVCFPIQKLIFIYYEVRYNREYHINEWRKFIRIMKYIYKVDEFNRKHQMNFFQKISYHFKNLIKFLEKS